MDGVTEGRWSARGYGCVASSAQGSAGMNLSSSEVYAVGRLMIMWWSDHENNKRMREALKEAEDGGDRQSVGWTRSPKSSPTLESHTSDTYTSALLTSLAFFSSLSLSLSLSLYLSLSLSGAQPANLR